MKRRHVKQPTPTGDAVANYERLSYAEPTWYDLMPTPADGTGTGFGAGVDWSAFDGAQAVTVGQPAKLALTGNMSFIVWASQNAGATGYEVVMTRDGADRFIFSLNDNTGKPFIGLDIGGLKTVTGTVNTNDSAWHMVVATYDGAKLKLYVDGALNAELAAAGSADIDTPTNLDFGADLNVPDDYLQGRLDTCRIYSRALSADEILRDYNAGKPAHT